MALCVLHTLVNALLKNQWMHTYYCSLGAALVADYHVQSTISRMYLQTIYNPLCPVRYEEATSKPDDWKDVSTSGRHG